MKRVDGGQDSKGPKKSGSLRESWATIRGSPKITNLALIVICYAVAHRLFEFAWKGQLRVLFPTAKAYSGALADVAIYTGAHKFMLKIGKGSPRMLSTHGSCACVIGCCQHHVPALKLLFLHSCLNACCSFGPIVPLDGLFSVHCVRARPLVVVSGQLCIDCCVPCVDLKVH